MQGVARVNGPSSPDQRLPNTLSISIKGLRASDLLMSLPDDLAASAGAACHSNDKATISSVLQAMNVSCLCLTRFAWQRCLHDVNVETNGSSLHDVNVKLTAAFFQCGSKDRSC